MPDKHQFTLQWLLFQVSLLAVKHVVTVGPNQRITTLPQARRLPPPSSIITREYKGRTIQVRILASGFEHDGVTHKCRAGERTDVRVRSIQWVCGNACDYCAHPYAVGRR